jgi:hypothetical protein
MQGILNQQDALVPSSPSFVVLLLMASPGSHARFAINASKWQTIVLGISGMRRRHRHRLSRARRVKMVNLEAVFARAAYKRPSATLVGNYQLGR